MKHAPSWNKLVEHFHGDDDVVFGDVTLLKNHVRQMCSVNLEPRQWQLAHDPSLQPGYRMRQRRIPEEDQPGHAPRTRSKMKYMQQYVKAQGDTPLCNVNRAEKGMSTLDRDQGEVPTVGEDRDREKESDHHAALKDHASRTRLAKSCGSRDDSLSWNLSRVKQGGAIRVTTWIHGSKGRALEGWRRVAVRRQDDAQFDRDWPEEGISAVSSVSSVRRTNASKQLRVSSSEERQDLRQGGLAMGFVSGDRTRRRLLRGQHKHWRSKKLHSNRLHQTCGPVNQQRHVCVEKCPLTMRHVAKRSGDSCGESQQSFGGGRGETREARSHPYSD